MIMGTDSYRFNKYAAKRAARFNKYIDIASFEGSHFYMLDHPQKTADRVLELISV